MKSAGFAILALLAPPLSLLIFWVVPGAVLEGGVHQLIPPGGEIILAVVSGLVAPVLTLVAIFSMTRSPACEAPKAIRACGVVGTVLAIALVFLAIPWIKLGIAVRGVEM